MHIAIVGCGQLARMLALAGWSMGMRFSFLAEPEEDTRCVEGLGSIVRLPQDKNAMSPQAIYAALGEPEVITVEKEAVDTSLLCALAAFCLVAPDPDILHTVQHRGRQKQFLVAQSIPVAPYRLIQGKWQLLQAAEALGYPLIIKSCEQGYDGQQQWRIRNESETLAFIAGDTVTGEAVVEQWLDFSREVSVLAVRNVGGELALYPATENRHRRGTLSVSIAPAQALSTALCNELESIANRLMRAWNYVGVLAIECFVVDDRILVNELAPRVHNSGHWTQNGAVCSQFANHLRAICGQSLGSTASLGHTAMINLLGCHAPKALISQPHAHLHWYDKTLRQGRKMGHVNLLHESPRALQEGLNQALGMLPG